MQAQTFKLHFKTRSIKDEAGNLIGKTKKQPSLDVSLPIPSSDELIAILSSDSKESKLIQEAVANIIVGAARDQFDEVIDSFGDDKDKEISVSVLDYDRLSLSYIASIPAAQRGTAALSEEDWTFFFEDYLAVMVAATGKEEARIKNHINLFKKPLKAKANKEVLNVLIDQLDIYLASSGNLDDTGTCASRIRSKFSKWATEEVKADLDLL